MRIAIFGAGAWGTSLALACFANGHSPCLWTRSPAIASDIKRRRENQRRLPGVRLPPGLAITASVDAAIRGSDAAIFALPGPALAAVLPDLRLRLGSYLPILSAGRGLFPGEAPTASAFLRAQLPQTEGDRFATLGGPLLASDFAREQPGRAVIAATSASTRDSFIAALSRPTLELCPSDDLTGTELANAYR
ncbi:MAG TPA: NAD(P)-binding domain-containing protein, partial [Polyangia bacterium]